MDSVHGVPELVRVKPQENAPRFITVDESS